MLLFYNNTDTTSFVGMDEVLEISIIDYLINYFLGFDSSHILNLLFCAITLFCFVYMYIFLTTDFTKLVWAQYEVRNVAGSHHFNPQIELKPGFFNRQLVIHITCYLFTG